MGIHIAEGGGGNRMLKPLGFQKNVLLRRFQVIDCPLKLFWGLFEESFPLEQNCPPPEKLLRTPMPKGVKSVIKIIRETTPKTKVEKQQKTSNYERDINQIGNKLNGIMRFVTVVTKR